MAAPASNPSPAGDRRLFAGVDFRSPLEELASIRERKLRGSTVRERSAFEERLERAYAIAEESLLRVLSEREATETSPRPEDPAGV